MLVTLVAMMLPVVGMGASVVVALRAMERHHRTRERGRCPGCGYDLAGLHAGVCPECGFRVHATMVAGGAARAAEVLVVPAIVVAQALLLPGVLSAAGTLADGVAEGWAPVARAAGVVLVMVGSAAAVGAAFSVRRTPRELTGVMLVYLIGAADTGIAWFVALAGPT